MSRDRVQVVRSVGIANVFGHMFNSLYSYVMGDCNYRLMKILESYELYKVSPRYDAKIIARIQSCLTEGADINYLDPEDGDTPLIIAMKRGCSSKIVKLLLDNGADANHRNNDGHSPLMITVTNCRGGVISDLVKARANINEVNSRGDTALMIAAGAAWPDMARILLESGANPKIENLCKDKALTLAAKSRNEDVVKVLLSNGVDIDKKDEEGRTPLVNMIKNGEMLAAKTLLKAGANPNAKFDALDCTPLMSAVLLPSNDLVEALLNAGADIDAVDSGGSTALIHAAKTGKTESVRLLLNAGADIDAVDSSGSTALIHAAKTRKTESVRLLLNRGPDIDVKDDFGKGAIDYASEAAAYLIKIYITNQRANQITNQILLEEFISKAEPEDLRCPIAFEIPKGRAYIVLKNGGQSKDLFDAEALDRWIKNHNNIHPLTRETIDTKKDVIKVKITDEQRKYFEAVEKDMDIPDSDKYPGQNSDQSSDELSSLQSSQLLEGNKGSGKFAGGFDYSAPSQVPSQVPSPVPSPVQSQVSSQVPSQIQSQTTNYQATGRHVNDASQEHDVVTITDPDIAPLGAVNGCPIS